MEINWFTFFAQILNFVVLIFVLQRWLYKPITEAMQRREKTIRDRLDSASQQQQQAQQELVHYQKMQQDLADRQTEMLTQAKLEAEQTRQRLLQEVHESVEIERSQWQASLKRQQESFLREVSHRTMQQLQTTVRRVLADLADSELEMQMARVFLQKLQNLAESERAELVTTLNAATQDRIALTLVSTFSLPTHICTDIATVLQSYFDVIGSGKVALNCEIQSSLICGIELRGSGYKLAWSMDAYLDAITENLVKVFAEESEASVTV
jgi:F-type H+-transporting ATPase subunit b